MSHLRRLLLKDNWLERRPAVPDKRSGPVEAGLEIPANDGQWSTVADGFALDDLKVEKVWTDAENRLIYKAAPQSAAADRFRLVRVLLSDLMNAGKLKILLITSALPADGKSTITLNLASAIADSGGRKVLVLEADLYHSPLLAYLGLSGGPGLAECLEADYNPMAAVRRTDCGWYLLPAGQASTSPPDILQNKRFPALMRELAAHFDQILIDSPPVLPVPDYLSLKKYADGSILVVRAGQTGRAALQEAIAHLGKQHVVAVILNAIDDVPGSYYKYKYGAAKHAVSPTTQDPAAT